MAGDRQDAGRGWFFLAWLLLALCFTARHPLAR